MIRPNEPNLIPSCLREAYERLSEGCCWVTIVDRDESLQVVFTPSTIDDLRTAGMERYFCSDAAADVRAGFHVAGAVTIAERARG